jgi:hypothetical protein
MAVGIEHRKQIVTDGETARLAGIGNGITLIYQSGPVQISPKNFRWLDDSVIFFAKISPKNLQVYDLED